MRRYALIPLLIATPAVAQMQSLKLATDIGTVIGSEEYCGLKFDQQAISEYVTEHADKTDLGFASTLTMMVQGTEYNISTLSPSGKTAHCAAVKVAATSFGFLK